MKKNKNIDYELAKEDFDTSYAKKLKNNPKRLEKFKERIKRDFNKTRNIDVFLMNLRILAMAGGITELSKKTKIKRPNIYRILKPNYQPKFETILNISSGLGIELYCA